MKLESLRSSLGRQAVMVTMAAVATMLCAAPATAQPAPDWKAEIRERVAAKQIGAALSIAERRVTQALYAVGTENFALADQVGHSSARTAGGGVRYALGTRQEFTGYVFQQDRSQGHSQIGFGFSYAIRF